MSTVAPLLTILSEMGRFKSLKRQHILFQHTTWVHSHKHHKNKASMGCAEKVVGERVHVCIWKVCIENA